MSDAPTTIPAPQRPLRGLRGLSRAKVARNMGLTEREVARLETTALLKARAAFEARGLDYRALLDLMLHP